MASRVRHDDLVSARRLPSTRPNLPTVERTGGPANQPSWHPDPTGRYEYRYYNGTSWTADVSTGGVRYVDPAGVAQPASGWVGPTSQPPQHRDRLATASLVLGIVGICLAWVPVLFVVGVICAVIAVVFAIVARGRTPRDTRGFIGAGLATGAAGIVVAAVGVWTTTLVFNAVDDYDNPPLSEVVITECSLEDGRVQVRGTLENVGDRASRFRVVVLIPARGMERRQVSIEVGRVEPGESESFGQVLESRGAEPGGLGDGCPIVRVTGPLPFGVEIET